MTLIEKTQTLNHEGLEGTRRRSVDLVIARDPLIGKSGKPYANLWYIAQIHARLGWLGTASVKCFGILIGAQGEGVPKIAGIADIARHRRDRPQKSVIW
jgi:hypothetical protein